MARSKGKAKRAGSFVEEYWRAIALGMEAENRKAALFVRHGPSLGVAREAILRNLVERQTPAPFKVVTGIVFLPPEAGLQPEPRFSRQCDLLVYDPTKVRPVYEIQAFAVVPYEACKFVIEVKSSLKARTFKELLDVWLSVFVVPTFGFAYGGTQFRHFLQLLSEAAKASPNPNEYSLLRLPECICVHNKNYLAFTCRDSDRSTRWRVACGTNLAVRGDRRPLVGLVGFQPLHRRDRCRRLNLLVNHVPDGRTLPFSTQPPTEREPHVVGSRLLAGSHTRETYRLVYLFTCHAHVPIILSWRLPPNLTRRKAMPKSEKVSVPVTLRSVLQRINRKLAKQGEVLKATRGERARSQMGDFFVIDASRNFLVQANVDPEALARELGVLNPWESVIEG
jgi:Domain of unknown function (DUF6602)